MTTPRRAGREPRRKSEQPEVRGPKPEASSAFDKLGSRRVVMFGGKGGVGKTTMSAFAALHYAKTKKVVLFTTDPASNLEDLFGDPATRRPGDLTIESIDANKLYARFLDTNLASLLEIGDRGTYLDREELRRFFELSLPGVDELMAWMRIGELAEEHVDAIIVVDTAPTGHTLRMLGGGAHFRQFAEALDALEAKHRGMVRQFTRRNVRDAVDEYITRFDEDARRRRELLTNAATAAFVPVFLSEPWVVEQTKRLIGEVREVGIDVPFAILNRAVLDPDCARDEMLVKRDADARAAIGTTVVDFPRSCVPIEFGPRSSVLSPRLNADELSASGSGALRETKVGLPESGEVRAVSFAANPRTEDRGPRTDSRLLFLAGKGGVGKTTCAASIALQLAQRHPERRYTIISVDPAHALRDVFASEKPPANLTVEIVNTRDKWQNFRETLGDEIERAVNAITPGNFSVAYDTEAVRKLIDIAPPGADELFAISRLADLAADQSQSMVIVDTAPTGHFLRLLDLPKTAGDWVREFMRILLRYRELVPPGSLGEELVSASKAMHSLEDLLHSDRASAIVVTRPERIVIAETKRLLEAMNEKQIKVSCVIANYVTPENDCKCDQQMRAHELNMLDELTRGPRTEDRGPVRPEARGLVLIERQDKPPATLAALAALFRVASD